MVFEKWNAERMRNRMTNKELCRLLRKLMAEREMSYNELARIAQVSHATISAWLNGKNSPRMETVGIILDALGYKMVVVSK